MRKEQNPSNNLIRDAAERIRNLLVSEQSLLFGAIYGGFSPDSSTDFV